MLRCQFADLAAGLDLERGVVAIVRRDTREKIEVPLGDVVGLLSGLLGEMQAQMLESARSFRDERTRDVTSLEAAIEAAQTGFARLPWDALADGGEARLKTEAITVRCLQRPDGSIPAHEREEGLIAIVAKSY